jgi:mannose-1-phosphate guanylyltransferase
MKALILSGGKGTRLRPLALYTPKPLLPVANMPFLSYPLALLKHYGIKETILCTSDNETPYKGLFAEQKKLGMKLTCSREIKELGTAGALKNAEKHVGDTFYVFNGDILSNLDLSAMMSFHKKNNALITIALVPVPDPSAYGLVMMNAENRVVKFIEKPSSPIQTRRNDTLINIGVYIFNKEVMDMIPAGTPCSVERELFPECLNRKLRVFGFPAAPQTYWLDIGTPEKYLEANMDVIQGRLAGLTPGKPSEMARGKGSKVHASASIHDTVIGPRSKIGPGCSVRNCVLLDGVILDEGVSLKDCVVGSGAKIGHNSIILGPGIIGNNSIITPYSKL